LIVNKAIDRPQGPIAQNRERRRSAVKGRLSLVCHGLTAGQRAGRFPADEPLQAGAFEAAALVAARFRSAPHVWSSPALCARETAAALGFKAAVEPALRECDYGRWQGARIAELMENEPENLALWTTDLSVAPHGGEPLAGLLSRVGAWLAQRLDAGGHSVVIAHASVIRAAVLHVLDAPREAFWRIDVEPLSVTEMTSDGKRWQLRFLDASQSFS
jgi:broad specificity phosphatase PhoE